MPLLDVSNPKTINFLLENYEKESRIRMKWVNLHGDLFAKAATLTREEKNYTVDDITKATIEAGMPTTTRDHITAARHKLTAPRPDYDYVTKTNARKHENAMKPVPSDMKDILRESSEAYLKKRSLLKPDEKYNFMECNNWKYGWKLEDSMLKMRGPEYGQVNQVMRQLRSRVGPQKDPDHYKQPDPGQKVIASL